MARRRNRHDHRASGQALVEFALTAPLFFGLVFGTMDGGLLMYEVSTASHMADTGSRVLAEQGSNANADTLAIQAMRQMGLGVGAKVAQYQIHMLNPNGSDTRDTNSCNNNPCQQIYDPGGTLVSGNWSPSLRNVTNGQSSYLELDVVYSWHYFVSGGSTINLTATRIVRLEPET